MSASLAFGCLNLLVAGLSMPLFRAQVPRAAWAVWGVALIASLVAPASAERMVSVVKADCSRTT